MADGATVKFTVRLTADERKRMEDEAMRQGQSSSGGLIHALIRGLNEEHHPLGVLSADLRLPSLLVEWVTTVMAHELECRDPNCHLFDAWAPLARRYSLRFIPKTEKPVRTDVRPAGGQHR